MWSLLVAVLSNETVWSYDLYFFPVVPDITTRSSSVATRRAVAIQQETLDVNAAKGMTQIRSNGDLSRPQQLAPNRPLPETNETLNNSNRRCEKINC